MEDDSLDRSKLTFAQAEGREPLPQPLAIGEVSQQLRAELWRVFWESLRACEGNSSMGGRSWIKGQWAIILEDKHVHVDHLMADEFDKDFKKLSASIRVTFEKGDYVAVLGFVQWVLRHRSCPVALWQRVDNALKRAHAPYRVVDKRTIFPIASEEEGKAVERAFTDLRKHELNGARDHLRKCGELINENKFADSVRECIHAVEAVARILDEKASKTLGPALTALEESTSIHPALKAGFEKIYGYTCRTSTRRR